MIKTFRKKHTGLIIGLSSFGGLVSFALFGAFIVSSFITSEPSTVSHSRRSGIQNCYYGDSKSSASYGNAISSFQDTKESLNNTNIEKSKAYDGAIEYLFDSLDNNYDATDYLYTCIDEASVEGMEYAENLQEFKEKVECDLADLEAGLVEEISIVKDSYYALSVCESSLDENIKTLEELKNDLNHDVKELDFEYSKMIQDLTKDFEENMADEDADTEFELTNFKTLMEDAKNKYEINVQYTIQNYEQEIKTCTENIQEINALIEDIETNYVAPIELEEEQENEVITITKTYIVTVEEIEEEEIPQPEIVEQPVAIVEQPIIVEENENEVIFLYDKFFIETENNRDKTRYWLFSKREARTNVSEI